MQICWFYEPAAPNVLCPNADGAPNPAAGCGATAVCVPKAGGADVVGALNEKFPNEAEVQFQNIEAIEMAKHCT